MDRGCNGSECKDFDRNISRVSKMASIQVLNPTDIPVGHLLFHLLKTNLMDIFREAKATGADVDLLDGYKIGFDGANSRGDDEFHILRPSVIVMGLPTNKTAGFFIVEHGVNREDIEKEDVLFSFIEGFPQVPKYHYFRLSELQPNVLAYGASSSSSSSRRSRNRKSHKNYKSRKNRSRSRSHSRKNRKVRYI
jgi:hypothetical protein